MKKVKIFSPHMELRIHVSDEMIKDYRACKERIERCEDLVECCKTCSWRDAKIGGVCACELVRLEQVLE